MNYASLPLIACLLVVVACVRVRRVWCMALYSVFTRLQSSRWAAATEMNDTDYFSNILQFKNQESKEAAEVAAPALVFLQPRSVTNVTQEGVTRVRSTRDCRIDTIHVQLKVKEVSGTKCVFGFGPFDQQCSWNYPINTSLSYSTTFIYC